MDEHEQNENELSRSQPEPQPRRWHWVVLIGPMIVCVGCMALAFLLVHPLLGGQVDLRQIPVTGATTHPGPTLRPVPLAPGETYRSAAQDRLTTCLSSFHDFFVLEQLGAHQPDVFASSQWRGDVTQAMQAFRDDCENLGRLPAAPPAYARLEKWLKLAAGEVGPAADGVSNALAQKRITDLGSSIDPMSRFIEYTHNAEAILNGLEEERRL